MQNGFILDSKEHNKAYYGGNMLKYGISIDNENYIVKAYNDCVTELYSEYVASRFICSMDVLCQEAWLGFDENNNKVVIVKDFKKLGEILKAYKDISQSSEDTDLSNKAYTYNDVAYVIDKNVKLNKMSKEAMTTQFWQQFMLDAILGNRDRHWGNWGYLLNSDRKVARVAPIYDNGGSLFPGVEKYIEEMKTDEKKFICDRSGYHPASVLRTMTMTGSKKSNYYKIIGMIADEKPDKYDSLSDEDRKKTDFEKKNMQIPEFIQIYNEFKSKYTVDDIADRIKDAVNTVMIEDTYQRFYKLVTITRYLHIILRKDLDESYEIAYRLV